MSIQGSILSMLSSVGTAAAVPKAISAMNKGVQAETPETPTQAPMPQAQMPQGYTGTNPMISTKEMLSPMQRVQLEQQRKKQQREFMQKVKEEFGKQDFSKVNLYPGGVK